MGIISNTCRIFLLLLLISHGCYSFQWGQSFYPSFNYFWPHSSDYSSHRGQYKGDEKPLDNAEKPELFDAVYLRDDDLKSSSANNLNNPPEIKQADVPGEIKGSAQLENGKGTIPYQNWKGNDNPLPKERDFNKRPSQNRKGFEAPLPEGKEFAKRPFDTLGSGVMKKDLDSVGTGFIKRKFDKLGTGVMKRSFDQLGTGLVKKHSNHPENSIKENKGNPNFKEMKDYTKSAAKLTKDEQPSIDEESAELFRKRHSILELFKRGLDTLGTGLIKKKKNLDTVGVEMMKRGLQGLLESVSQDWDKEIDTDAIAQSLDNIAAGLVEHGLDTDGIELIKQGIHRLEKGMFTKPSNQDWHSEGTSLLQKGLDQVAASFTKTGMDLDGVGDIERGLEKLRSWSLENSHHFMKAKSVQNNKPKSSTDMDDISPEVLKKNLELLGSGLIKKAYDFDHHEFDRDEMALIKRAFDAIGTGLVKKDLDIIGKGLVKKYLDQIDPGFAKKDLDQLGTGLVKKDLDQLGTGLVKKDLDQFGTGLVKKDLDQLGTGLVKKDLDQLGTGLVKKDLDQLGIGLVKKDFDQLGTGLVKKDLDQLGTGLVKKDLDQLGTGLVKKKSQKSDKPISLKNMDNSGLKPSEKGDVDVEETQMTSEFENWDMQHEKELEEEKLYQDVDLTIEEKELEDKNAELLDNPSEDVNSKRPDDADVVMTKKALDYVGSGLIKRVFKTSSTKYDKTKDIKSKKPSAVKKIATAALTDEEFHMALKMNFDKEPNLDEKAVYRSI